VRLLVVWVGWCDIMGTCVHREVEKEPGEGWFMWDQRLREGLIFSGGKKSTGDA